jgi:hypothetical protein
LISCLFLTLGLFSAYNLGKVTIRDACSSLSAWPCDAKKCDYGLLIRPNSTVCFLTHFEDWANTYKSTDVRALVGTESNRATYMGLLSEFRANAYPLDDYSKSYDEVIGFTDKRPKDQGPSFVQLQGTMTMPLLTPLVSKYDIEDSAKKFLKNIDRPETAKHVFQWTYDWVWSVTQEGTIQGLTSGMAIAFPLAFIALIIATSNWFISFFATLSVGGIVASVLGACKLNGWALGTGEAVAGGYLSSLAHPCCLLFPKSRVPVPSCLRGRQVLW